jgi:RecJ-like exonuclease
MIFGDVLTLKNFPEELKDAKEFATILNACANMNEPATGLALCLGNGKNLESARNLLKAYRRMIGNYRKWIEDNPTCIKQTDNAIYIMGQDAINENFIGTIVSMLFRPAEKTLIGFGNSKDGIKVSARSKSSNIRDIMVEAAKACGGVGGGHENAAGALIPAGNQEKFIESCETLLSKNSEEKSSIKV